MQALAGKVAIVTGASRGIGEAAAIALAEAGASVMLTARNGAQVNAHAQQIAARAARQRHWNATSPTTTRASMWCRKPRGASVRRTSW